MQSIPFSVPDLHGGFSEGRGRVHIDGDDIVFETQVKLLSIFDRRPQTHRIELVDLESVRHKRTVLGDRITICTRPMTLVTEIPGSANGELVLKVKRRHRAAVDDLLERLRLWVVS